jgi:hypothetical protein
MVFLPNPPKADKSLRLPREMQSLFLWGYAQKIILGISTICLWLFFSHALILDKNPPLWKDTRGNYMILLNLDIAFFYDYIQGF